MSEFVLRAVAPALVIVVEREAPTRLFTTLTAAPDLAALRAWIESSEDRRALIAAALSDWVSTDGPGRGSAWVDTLAAEKGGIAHAVERLLERQAEQSGTA